MAKAKLLKNEELPFSSSFFRSSIDPKRFRPEGVHKKCNNNNNGKRKKREKNNKIHIYSLVIELVFLFCCCCCCLLLLFLFCHCSLSLTTNHVLFCFSFLVDNKTKTIKQAREERRERARMLRAASN